MSSVATAPPLVRPLSQARILGILRPFDATAAITLWMLVVLQHDTYWNTAARVAAIAACVGTVRRSSWFWLALAAALLAPMLPRWHAYEDHLYFAVAWIAAVGISLLGSRRRRCLAASARMLIALAMGLAVLWKAISGQYLSGETFHHRMLSDARFRTMIAQPIAGLGDAATDQNRAAVARLRASDRPLTVSLSSTPRLSIVAAVITGWTILIELALAACFALPHSARLDAARNPLLLMFMTTTYVVVPVVGFGMLFSALGIAQCRREERHWQFGYFLFAALLAVYAGLGYDHLVG